MQIDISEKVARRLTTLAQQQGVALDDLLGSLLDQAHQPRYATLAEIAQSARDASMASADAVDSAANSRAILNAEFADYLKRHTHDHSG